MCEVLLEIQFVKTRGVQNHRAYKCLSFSLFFCFCIFTNKDKSCFSSSFFLKYSRISGPTNDVKVKGQMNTKSVPGLVPGPYFGSTFSEIK